MIIDIAVLVVVLISAVIAFLRGFIREILTIFGTLGAFAAAYLLGGSLSPLIEGMLGVREGAEIQKLFGILPYDLLAKIIAYASIFIIVIIVLSLLSHFIAETAKSMGLGAIDRTFGFIFGLLRGIFIIGLLYLPVHIFVDQESKDSWFANSNTHFYIEQTAGVLAGFLPDDTATDIQDTTSELQDDAEALDEGKKALDRLGIFGESILGDKEINSEDLKNQDGYEDNTREDLDSFIEQEILEPEQQNNFESLNE